MLWIKLIVFLAALFFACELAARAVLRSRYGRHYKYKLFNYFLVDDPVYGFAFRKNAKAKEVPFPIFDKFVFGQDRQRRVDFNVNSLGFRGPEFAPKKTPGALRIFTSGGSTTAGIHLGDAETWPAVLERELGQRGVRAEVINAGVPGWYSYQERLRFERELINYEPDIVLLHEGWNEEFVYSMHNLGKAWQPRLLMNAAELGMHARAPRIFSGTASVFFHLVAKSYFQDFRFRRTMSFANPKRWEQLRSARYIEHWFDNLMGFARVASQKGIKLYTINPPALCDFEDARGERELYAAAAGLNPYFLDYQAVSKKRIQKTFLEAASIIPCLDAEKTLLGIRGRERAALFLDEIHLNAKGNALLGKTVAEQILADKNFTARGSNIIYDDRQAKALRSEVGSNYDYIDDYLEKKTALLKNASIKDGKLLEMPLARYTTF